MLQHLFVVALLQLVATYYIVATLNVYYIEDTSHVVACHVES
jgi:hypothetical protein